MDGSKILIFVETKRGADELTKEMRLSGWPALAIHGDKRQEERDWVLKEFREGRNPILIVGIIFVIFFPVVTTRGKEFMKNKSMEKIIEHPLPSSPNLSKNQHPQIHP